MTPALLLLALLPLDLSTVSEKPCLLPDHPPRLVLGVKRFIMPIGGGARTEAGQVTFDGECTPLVECVKVSLETLARVAATVRTMGVVRHHKGPVSPHYGRREVRLRWKGGECSVSDGYDSQIDDPDSSRFSAALNAILDALIEGRPPQKK